ncbi:hypothetical protein ENUP19_0052G0004 [Entamoeba nuttalli]|uniref:Cysteine protease inhibitor 2 (EhICP2), putative n=2 Tax=Entamoeba nuttalli TaxID=412467 RepID=K2GBM8_ENTNP|nr:cysteine protease inhibitor 2 (EhICP2), putative [Entamoeba nuttalli P19]EKE39951.1 cysteine protease inhibitor 2 (EhICP2), putative [Entamoeba nuttalli P19]|eukprot:XP_008857713.1 cysteine protease inhibitor 2 (EhICP2), putative [Entamoeba nuttalli P19]
MKQFIFFALLYTSTYAAIHILTEKEDHATLHVSFNDLIKIQLRTNPSTGYAWNIEYPTDTFSLSQDTIKAEPHPSGMVGFPSIREIQLKPLKVGTTTIKLGYSRPWEKGKEPLRSLTYTVVIR